MSEKIIKKVAKLMDETGLMEIITEESILFGLIRSRVHLSKRNVCTVGAATGASMVEAVAQPAPSLAAPVAAMAPSAAAAPKSPGAGAVTSPMVGVVYLAPEPNAKPFVTVGKQVSKGDTLCLVEAMKTYNPIKADKDGTVAEILVKEGDTVEFGTPLVVVG